MNTKEVIQMIIDSYKRTVGKGPGLVKINIDENVIILDVKGVLTPLEQTLLKYSSCNKELIKSMRSQITENELAGILEMLRQLSNNPKLEIKSYSMEFDYENDRQFMLFIFSHSLQNVIRELPDCG